MSYQSHKFDDNIVRLLKNGAVGLLPTDTVYGLSCVALDKTAVERVHKLKRRDKSKPFVILISKATQLNELGVAAGDVSAALKYWPGRLTLVCKAAKAPDWLQMGTYSLAIRQPDYPGLRQLIDAVGPIISTSANLAGDQPAASVKQAQTYFGDKLDFYVDAGRLSGLPSTIIRISNNKLEVLRQGAVKSKEEK